MKMQSVKKAGGSLFGKSPSSAKKRNALICAAALVIVILIVITFLLLSGSETAYRSISIAELSGKVMTENNGKSYAAYENMVIGGGYALTTEEESYTRMLLDSDKYMKLEERSHAVFENLGDPQSHRTVIRLNYGTFTTEITKPLGNQEDYIVNTPNAVLAVRGTFFRVEVSFDTNGDAYTDVYTYGGAVACHRIMPDGTEVDEEVMIGTGYKARIKMDEIITVYVEELIEQEMDHVDPLEMSDMGDGQLVDVYNASAHGHEMFRSTGELWDEIVEREINLDDYTSAYDGGKIRPYTEDEPKPAETFVTTPAPGTPEQTNPSGSTEPQQPESSLLSETTGAEPVLTEADFLPAETTTANAFPALLPAGDLTAAPTGNVAAETVVPNPITAPTGRPGGTTAPPELPETTAEETDESTEETEETEEPEDSEESEETTTTTAWVNTSPSAEIVTRPPVFTTTTPSIPVITTAVTEPSHVHTLIEETFAASCTADGAVRTKCAVCGTVVSETVVPALGHNTGSVTVAATCEEDGERLDVCKLCGVIVAQATLPAAGHIADVTTVAATCTNDGERTEKCRICGKVLSTATLPAAGHAETAETVEATCTEGGSVTVKCSVCGEVLSEESIPAAGHREVTESDGGIETVKCSVCGEIFSQTVPINEENFPDEVFRNYVSRNFDMDGDGALSEEERAAVTVVDVSGTLSDTYDIISDGGITSLKGIEYFSKLIELNCTANGGLTAFDVSRNTALETLYCYNTQVTSLNVRQNTALKDLQCFFTPISELDVSQNTLLLNLECDETDLTSLDVSQNTLLLNLMCGHTNLTSLDVHNNTALTSLDCSSCQLAYIDISNNSSLSAFRAVRNLYCITVTDGSFDTHTIDGFDPTRVSNVVGAEWDETTGIFSKITEGTTRIWYSYDCDNMGCNTTFGLDPDENSTFASETPEGVANDETNFPDEVFRNYVSENFDTDGDGTLSEEERGAVTEIDVSGTSSTDGGVTSMKGIEYFTELTELKCQYNKGLTELDVSQNTELNSLYCNSTQIASLDVRQNTALRQLHCAGTQISSLDVSHNTALKILICYSTQITSLDVSNNTALEYLSCYYTKIDELDVSQNTALQDLYCAGTQITSLDVSKNTALQELQCDISRLAYVDVSNNLSISFFTASGNEHFITVIDGSFDTHTIDGFDPTRVSNVQGAEWDETTGVFSGIIEGTTEITYTYDCDSAGGHNETFTLVPDENSTFAPETPEGVAIDEENFPDEVFRNYVSENFDTDSDGELSQAEIEAVTRIDVNGTFSTDGGVTSMKGVEYFSGLTELKCHYNRGITELDVSQNTALTGLWCHSTQITELDVSQNTVLTDLECGETQITSLDVSNNTALTNLQCYSTQITSLDVRKNMALTCLQCGGTQITSLDVSNNTLLTELYCYNTQITSLDISKNTALADLFCGGCQLAYIDIFNNLSISYLSASGNKYPIPSTALSFDVSTINGFNPNRVSNVVGANFSPESGIFYNFTSDTITYTYDCDGAGGHNVTFTLVRSDESAASLSDEGGAPEGYLASGLPASGGGTFPSEGVAVFSLLPPFGFLAIAIHKKRKTGFRFTKKIRAERLCH